MGPAQYFGLQCELRNIYGGMVTFCGIYTCNHMYPAKAVFTSLSYFPSAMRLLRSFTTSVAHLKKPLPPRPVLPDSELHHAYLKGSGPGGQKINKTNSAVQLTH